MLFTSPQGYLYTVLFFNGDGSLGDLQFHALNQTDAERKVRIQFKKEMSRVITVGLTIGAREDSTGIYI